MRHQRLSITLLLTLLTTIGAGFLGGCSEPLAGRSPSVQSQGDRRAQADRLLPEGNWQAKNSRYRLALQYWEAARNIYRELGERKAQADRLLQEGKRQAEADRLLQEGNWQAKNSQYRLAIQYWEAALDIYRELGNLSNVGRSLGNLGLAYNSLGQYGRAISYYQQSIEIFKEIENRPGEGFQLRGLGDVYKSIKQYQRAISYYQQSLEISREINARPATIQSLNKLVAVYNLLGKYQQAREYYQQVLEMYGEIGDRPSDSMPLSFLGDAYKSIEQYQRAISYYQQSLEISREIGDRYGAGISLGSLGNAYHSLEQYQQAISYHQQSLDISREIGNRYVESRSLNGLGNAYLFRGQYQQALKYYQQSLPIFRDIDDPYTLGNTLNNFGYALFKSGDLPAAEKNLFLALEVLESIRPDRDGDSNQISVFDTPDRTYRTLQQVLTAQNKTNTALEISERGRARAFVELLTSQVSPDNGTQLAPPTLKEIQRIARKQNATIVQYSRVTDRFKIEGKQESKESELYIWVIKPTGEIAFRQTDLKHLWQKEDRPKSLATVVDQARCFGNSACQKSLSETRQGDILGSRQLNLQAAGRLEAPTTNSQPNNRTLQQLHQLLIDPIADLLPKNEKDRVIFIPQDSLFLVPFPALQDEAGNYLIEKHTTLIAPSIQSLNFIHQQRTRTPQINTDESNDILVVGNPDMPELLLFPGEEPQQLSTLMGAEKEAIEIAQIFETQALVGNAATESVVVQKMPSARIIHLATHGKFDPFRGIGSWIALTPDPEVSSSPPGNDGLLLAEEILDLKLNAELVVLSACSTGGGKITGDGVIGLSRSLISAGVESVIVSLWKMPDSPTQELMIEFYKNWQKYPDLAQSLRQAMLKLVEKYPNNPENWAAFTLIGEAE